MKIALIAPYSLDLGGNFNNAKYQRFLLGPNAPIYAINPALPTLAALTPNDIEVKIIDESLEAIDYDSCPDLVGISYFTYIAQRTYNIADEFRRRNIPVVLGGIHASFLPEEAVQHADSVVIGEAEEIWPIVLNDFKDGKLKKYYRCEKRPDISKSPVPRWDLTKRKNYLLHMIQTSRGCPYDCEFCSVKAFLGPQYRFKKDEQVLSEVQEAINEDSKKPIFFCDDNFFANKERAKRLLKLLQPLNAFYGTQTTLDIAQDNEMLELMAESNFKQVFIGFESIYPNEVKKMSKSKILKSQDYEKAIEHIQSFGIKVVGSFIFGFDNDTQDTILSTVDFIKKSDLIKVVLNILTPYPGTRYFERLEKERRIITRDWSKYSHAETVMKHPNFKDGELDKCFIWALEEIFAYENIFERIYRVYQKWNTLGITKADRISPLVDSLGIHEFYKELKIKVKN